MHGQSSYKIRHFLAITEEGTSMHLVEQEARDLKHLLLKASSVFTIIFQSKVVVNIILGDIEKYSFNRLIYRLL